MVIIKYYQKEEVSFLTTIHIHTLSFAFSDVGTYVGLYGSGLFNFLIFDLDYTPSQSCYFLGFAFPTYSIDFIKNYYSRGYMEVDCLILLTFDPLIIPHPEIVCVLFRFAFLTSSH